MNGYFILLCVFITYWIIPYFISGVALYVCLTELCYNESFVFEFHASDLKPDSYTAEPVLEDHLSVH